MGKDTGAAPRPEFITHNIAKRLDSKNWGSAYVDADEPEPDVPGFQLAEDFPKVPARIHSAWYRLAQETCDGRVTSVDSGSEVGIVLARDVATFREWRAFVPRQSVGGAHVSLRMDKLCDIVTGEEFDGIPPAWRQAGTAHSHNTMRAFFSSTDDDDELGIPGLHYVLGELDAKAYGWAASIVLRGVRYELSDIRQIADVTPRQGEFHKRCLDYITQESVSPVHVPKYERTFQAFNGLDEDVDWAKVFAKYDDERKGKRKGIAETRPRFEGARYDAGDERRLALMVARHHATREVTDKATKRMLLALCDACEKSFKLDPKTRDVIWGLMLNALDDNETSTYGVWE